MEPTFLTGSQLAAIGSRMTFSSVEVGGTGTAAILLARPDPARWAIGFTPFGSAGIRVAPRADLARNGYGWFLGSTTQQSLWFTFPLHGILVQQPFWGYLNTSFSVSVMTVRLAD